MCGIVGYLGISKAAPVLLSELRCLEYRGYDSAGVAVIEDGRLAVLKAAGKLSNLETLLTDVQPSATVGIGHTRWATHGVPNDQNAHPHLDCTSTLAIVHNGIIENYLELREELTAAGHAFSSETDTEVVAHLIEDELKHNQDDMLLGIRKAVQRLKGAYALGIVSQKHPNTIYAVNHHYSLAVGLGDNESYLASDSVAVCQYTKKVLRLAQSEIAEITTAGARLFSFAGVEVKRNPVSMDSTQFVMDKQGHKHFLLKEIHEQPVVLRRTIGKYLIHPGKPINFAGVSDHGSYSARFSDEELKRIERIKIVACGTAFHAGLVGKYIIEELCGIPVDVETASEARSRRQLVDEKTLAIAVSQSGETADTLSAIGEAKNKGAIVLGITNRPDSHLSLLCPHLLVTECGIEVSVAATKTFTAQVACFYLLAIYLAERKGLLPEDRIFALKAELLRTPALIERILASQEEIREKSIAYSDAQGMMFIGRGVHYPVALEGALKLKELSYIHASGYAAGEMKHGPIAVLDEKVPCLTMVIPGTVYEKTLSNAQEAKARKARMIAVAVEGDELVGKTFETVFSIPPVSEFFSPLISVVPLQLMSAFIADHLGKDVDQPRNLAKSVTVE
ncbi:MAG: glutamine--fructose-6-phosphate transaminase (isomerizing) [Candidatus Obscuribacterales bacterium]|nr:glutamine--fructose-6-phosphate transaminase (isomerizing) [Candidatus Obscuribacterales bacterium]